MNEDQLHLIGTLVDGTFCTTEGDLLIFSSDTFPSHRITVREEKVDKMLDEYAESLVKIAQAE